LWWRRRWYVSRSLITLPRLSLEGMQDFGSTAPSNGMNFTTTSGHSSSLRRTGQFFNMNLPSSNMERHARPELE